MLSEKTEQRMLNRFLAVFKNKMKGGSTMLYNSRIKQPILQQNIQNNQTLTNIANVACGTPFYCYDTLLVECTVQPIVLAE